MSASETVTSANNPKSSDLDSSPLCREVTRLFPKTIYVHLTIAFSIQYSYRLEIKQLGHCLRANHVKHFLFNSITILLIYFEIYPSFRQTKEWRSSETIILKRIGNQTANFHISLTFNSRERRPLVQWPFIPIFDTTKVTRPLKLV